MPADREARVQIVNQYSFLLVAAFSLASLAFILLRDGVKGSDLIALASFTLGFTAAFALLRPRASAASDAEAVLGQVGAGTPVLLELQSPY
jgi:non-homologous end joining protein Ku